MRDSLLENASHELILLSGKSFSLPLSLPIPSILYNSDKQIIYRFKLRRIDEMDVSCKPLCNIRKLPFHLLFLFKKKDASLLKD